MGRHEPVIATELAMSSVFHCPSLSRLLTSSFQLIGLRQGAKAENTSNFTLCVVRFSARALLIRCLPRMKHDWLVSGEL